MSFLTDGYLNLNVDSASPTVMYINIPIQSIALLVQFAICSMAIIKMRLNPKTNMWLKACFVVSSFCACSNTVSFALVYLLDELPILWFIKSMSWCCFFLSLVCTAILKLFITFNSSVYRMSRTMIRLFAVVVVLIFLCTLTASILELLVQDLREQPFFTALFLFNFFLYSVGCLFAVYVFVRDLLKLAETQRTSICNSGVTGKDMELTAKQQKLVNLATKSMMLFAIQLGSTMFIQVIVMWLFPIEVRGPFVAVDITLNLFCAYCQFGFSERHYQKCCGFCDRKFQGITLDWITKRIASQPLSENQTNTLHASIPSRSPSTTTASPDDETIAQSA